MRDPQLGGGPFRVGDDEDRADVDAALDPPNEALDQDCGLTGACAGGDEDEPLGLDRSVLLGGRRALGSRGHRYALPTRHIEPSLHHDGHEPSRGSCLTSPSRMRATIRRATSCALSTFPQKSSSST